MSNRRAGLQGKHGLIVACVFSLCLAAMSPIQVHVLIAQELATKAPPADPLPPNVPEPAATPDEGIAPSVPEETTAVASSVAEAAATGAAETVESTPEPAVVEQSEIATAEDLQSLSKSLEAVAEAQRNTEETIRTLSVEPGIRPLLPADRPAWVGAPTDVSGKNHWLSVGSIPTLHERDADSSLDEPLVEAVRSYIDEYVTHSMASSFSMPIDAEFIRRNMIDDHAGYVCELGTKHGALWQKWVRVRITPEQRDMFKQWHTEEVQRNRLGPLVCVVTLGLAFVGLTHLLLRTRHGVTSLPRVNQAVPAEVRESSKRGWLFAMVLFTLVFVGGVLLMAPLATVKIQGSGDRMQLPSPTDFEVEMESAGEFIHVESPKIRLKSSVHE